MIKLEFGCFLLRNWNKNKVKQRKTQNLISWYNNNNNDSKSVDEKKTEREIWMEIINGEHNSNKIYFVKGLFNWSHCRFTATK